VIEDGRVVLTLVALLVGAGGGAWTAHRLWRRRFETKLRGVTSALQQQHQVVLDRFRSAHAKLHSDLEQPRSNHAPRCSVSKSG
jgi:hypothetical protein